MEELRRAWRVFWQQNWLFEFREFVVVHHTDCGALHWTTEGLRGFIRERAPGDEGIDKLDFGDIAE